MARRVIHEGINKVTVVYYRCSLGEQILPQFVASFLAVHCLERRRRCYFGGGIVAECAANSEFRRFPYAGNHALAMHLALSRNPAILCRIYDILSEIFGSVAQTTCQPTFFSVELVSNFGP